MKITIKFFLDPKFKLQQTIFGFSKNFSEQGCLTNKNRKDEHHH